MDTRRAPTILVGVALCLMAVMGPASASGIQSSSGWTQFQGDATHAGAVADAAPPPYRQAWALPVAPGGPDRQFGLSAPVIDPSADTAVGVGPDQVIGVDLGTGSQSFELRRVFGPSVSSAFAAVNGKTAIVYTQGWGDQTPTASSSPSGSSAPSPSAASAGPPGISQMVAVDLATRRRLWDPVALAAGATVRPIRTGVTVSGDTAYVADSGGTVFAVDLVTGKLRWTEPAGGQVATAVAVSGDIVVVTTQGTRTVAPAVVGMKVSDGSVAWRYDGEPVGALAAGAVVSGEVVYVVFSDGNVRALGLSDGAERWTSRINAPVLPTGGLAVAGDGVFVLDIVGQLYRFSTADGARVWDFALNQPSFGAPPVVAGGHVLVGTNAGNLAAIDVGSGHLVWESGASDGLLRGFAPTADLIVAVKGGHGAGLVAYRHDDAGALIDVASPTVFDAGTNAVNFAAAAIPLFVLALVGGRLLSRRMGPAFIFDDDAASDPIEDGESP